MRRGGGKTSQEIMEGKFPGRHQARLTPWAVDTRRPADTRSERHYTWPTPEASHRTKISTRCPGARVAQTMLYLGQTSATDIKSCFLPLPSFLPLFVFSPGDLIPPNQSSQTNAMVWSFFSYFSVKIIVLLLLLSNPCPSPGPSLHASWVRAAPAPALRWTTDVCSVNVGRNVSSFMCSAVAHWVHKAWFGLTLAQYKAIGEKGDAWTYLACRRANSA